MVRRWFWKFTVGTLLVVVALGVFGCGGDSGSSLTKSEFIKRGNEICGQTNEERVQAKAQEQKDLGLEPGEIATPAQHKKIVEATLGPYDRGTEELQDLIPSDQAEQLEPLIEAREEVAETVRSGTGSATVSFAAIKKSNELALQYGLKECTV
jgi:hypothetical protein